MIRVAGNGRSGNQPPSASSSTPYSSSSTLSPLAPPFTVDRSLPAVTNPSSLSPPPPPGAAASSKSAYSRTYPNGATVPYFVPTGDSVWSPSSSAVTAASSRSGNLNTVLGAVEAAPYYPYYAPARDSVDGSLGQLPDYSGYVGGWNGKFDVEKGIPARGSVANSSWMDPSPSSQMSLPSHKRGSAESFNAHEESFGSWHGAHIESSSVLGQVGSDSSEWLDNMHLGIYVDCSRAQTDGSRATKLDAVMWPNEGSSYFYSPETTSVVKECDTFIPSSYDRYISQLSSSSRDPKVHYSAPTSSSRHGYAPSNEKNGSLFSSTASKHGNSVLKHANLQKRDDDYTVGKRHDDIICENAEGKEGLDKMGISGDAMWKNSGTPGSSLSDKGLSSGNINSSPLGLPFDCLHDIKAGFKVSNLSCCKASKPEIGAFISDDCMENSSDLHDHLNVAVDSPCWKGASVSRVYPFGLDEILEPLVISVISGSDDLVKGQMPSKIQSDIEQADISGYNENGKNITLAIPKDLSAVSYFSDLDRKLQDCTGTGRVSNLAKIENAKETEQDIHGEHNVLIEHVSVPQGIDDHVRQLSQVEHIICEGSSNACEPVPSVLNSKLGANHISDSPNYPNSSKTCFSNGEMILSSHDTIFSNELKKPVSSDASSKCLSQIQDTRALVKAMLSLSEVLLCHYCNDNDSFKEDLKPVRQIIDNLEAVLRNKKDITGSCSRIPRVEDTQFELKESNNDMSCNKDLKGTEEKNKLLRSGLNNEKHDNLLIKSFNTNFEEADSNTQEEDPKMLLYKKLWMQTETALCSLKHDVAFMKLEMEDFKHQFKGELKTHTFSAGSAGPDSHRSNEHQGPNCAAPIYVLNPSTIEVERNHKQSILEEDEDASVFARFRILKGRHEAEFACTDQSQEMRQSRSDVDAIEKGVLQSHNAGKITAASLKVTPGKNLPGLDYRIGNGLFLNDSDSAGAQELHLSASDGSIIQSFNPKNHVKWLFSSGSDSPSSEWEHVLKDDFSW